MANWKRIKYESSKSYSYFCHYRDMGTLRTLEKVAKEFNRSIAILGRYSSKYGWVKRANEYDRHIEEIKRLENEKEIKRFAREKVQLGTELMDKGQDAIKVLTEDLISPTEATRLIGLGNEIKKEGFGITDKKELEVNVSGELNITDLVSAYERIKGKNAGKSSE